MATTTTTMRPFLQRRVIGRHVSCARGSSIRYVSAPDESADRQTQIALMMLSFISYHFFSRST